MWMTTPITIIFTENGALGYVGERDYDSVHEEVDGDAVERAEEQGVLVEDREGAG